MNTRAPNPNQSLDQKTGFRGILQDPLLVGMMSTGIVLTGLTVLMFLEFGTGRVLGDTPWYIPVTHGIAGLAAFSVAFLALGRFSVLRGAASYWIGIAFTAFSIQTVFFILTWPGLLPGGRSILADLPSTSGWIAVFELASLSVPLIFAVISRWPNEHTWPGRRWLLTIAGWVAAVTILCILLVVFETTLPVLVDAQGNLNPLILSFDWIYLILFIFGAVISARRYYRTGDTLIGHVAFTQMALAFVVLTALIGAKRYDIWYYLSRMIIVLGFLVLMFGLLSEYVRLYRMVRESENNYRELVQNANSAIIRWGCDGKISFFNEYAQRFFGYQVEEVVGKHVSILVPPTETTGKDLTSLVQDIIDNPDRYESNINENILRDGRRVWMAWTNKPIYDTEGRVMEILAVGTDITDRKRMEEALHEYAARLEQSNKALEHFAYVASHDLQEPIRKIRSFGDRVKTRIGDQIDDETKDFLNRMQDASRRMETMIDDLLQLSRVNTRGHPFEEVDLKNIAEEVVSDLEYRIHNTGGVVVVEDLPQVQADPVQMQQLLQNLIGNALKFHKPGTVPQVKVYAKTNGKADSSSPEMAKFYVSDNGIGFDEEYADRIFQPFERLVGRSEYEGSGIGLAICKTIVERHGGTITARSKRGEGSTFIVKLPYRN